MIPSDVAAYASEPAPEGTPVTRAGERPVDVLILTALQDELDAVLALGDEWSERQDRGGFPYHQRQFTREGGKRPLVVAAAWLGKMGRTVAAIRGGAFLRELDPACVAMCGICAGMRGETALGDVIIADRLYSFDEGKLVAVPGKDPELHHDIKTYDLHPLWTMNAASVKREIGLPAWQKLRPPSKEAQGRWLLHAQYEHEVEGGPAPDAHAEQESACPNWTELLDEAGEKGLLVLKAGALSLTEAGREVVLNERRRFQKKLPRDPDLRVHVGTVGTGSAVQKDPGLFPRLRRVMRSTIGVEMEGAAIGELAQHFEKRGIVVKAVSDHGDLQKDDSFRKFACRASAEVLLAFLVKYFEPGREEEAQPASLLPSPSRDLKVQALRDDLEAAHVRKQRLVQSGLSTSDVDRDILNLRRAMRAGGQLREGDALGNGRYLLVRRIGKGGFAIVWEAIDTSRGERVALKVLHPELAGDPLRLERFFRGAREMAELTHEAVVRVFEQHGEDDGLHYFVMEFAPGGDLRRAVLEKRVSAEDVLGIIDRVADALAAAHAKGLVHRDVKPANILLDESGAPRLTDFDLVAAADTTGGTRTGAMGTFLYAAPELMDRPQDADARADVYGLGMTAVFALYGAELPVFMMMTQRERFIDGLSCGVAVKAALKKAVAWDAEARFANVTAFREALRRTRPSLVGAGGSVLDRLAAAGAAPPLPGEAAPMWWVPASQCNAVAWSRSGDLLASGHDDGAIRLWDAVSGKAIRTIFGPSKSVRSVAFSPDGNMLASGSEDKMVRLWDVAKGTLLRDFSGHRNAVYCVAFSPDGTTLASGAEDKTVRLWDVATAAFLRAFSGHANTVWSVAFSPDGSTLASGSTDTTVRLWDVATAAFLRAFSGHANPVRSVAFSPDGTTLASGAEDRTVRLWDIATAAFLRAFSGHRNSVRSVAFSPDGATLASGSDDKTVRLWDVATATLLRVFSGHANPVRSVAFSPDGTALASGSSDETVRLWDVATGTSLHAFSHHTEAVWSLTFSPDGTTIASASEDKTVRLWDVVTGTSLHAFSGHTEAVWSVAFSPDGTTLASGSDDHTVRLWDVATATTLRAFSGHTEAVWSVAFSPDGTTLAATSEDKTVRLWDVATGTTLRVFSGHTNAVASVAFSPDGTALASGSDDKTVRLWNVATATSLRTFSGHASWVRSVAFSPDGATLASGSDDKTVRLWNVATATLRCSFTGHTNAVTSVAFSPDGLTLASASADGSLRLWSVATAACLAILLPSPEGWVAFTPDGRYKLGGDIAGSFWHVIGLCRFEPGELDPYLPHLRIPDAEPLFTRPGT